MLRRNNSSSAPQSIKKDAIAFNSTFSLGRMAALLIVILDISGMLLRYYYEPFPQKAYIKFCITE